MKFNFNCIGYGYVGSSMGYLCQQNNIPYNVYDVVPYNELNYKGKFNYFRSLVTCVNNAENSLGKPVYIIAVPTPSDTKGNCDVSIIKKVLKELSQNITQESIIIIKSTIKPGSMVDFNAIVSDKIDLVFSPEFLRENTAHKDIYDTEFVLLGINQNNHNLKQLLTEIFTKYLYKHKYKWYNVFRKPKFQCLFRSYEECELFKYTLNTFLAVKIWYFNEIYELCDKLSVDYQHFKTLFPLDTRIGQYGTIVPGETGYGFSKKCLPKETLGMKHLQQEYSIPNNILSEIILRNNYFIKKSID